MQMYSHYINKGMDLNKLINLDGLDKSFYIASMIYEKEYNVKLLSEFIGGMKGGI